MKTYFSEIYLLFLAVTPAWSYSEAEDTQGGLASGLQCLKKEVSERDMLVQTQKENFCVVTREEKNGDGKLSQYDHVIFLVHSKEAKLDLSPWTQNT